MGHTTELQNYSLFKGMEFVASWMVIVFAIILVFGIRSQYRLMNTYDALSALNSSPDKKARTVLAHAKRVIFSLLGYQGEERERQTLDELHADWLLSNFGKIFVRFATFYFIYIWALILTTRALQIDAQTGQVQLLAYTSKQIFGFAMICVYIISNSVLDIVSLYFTVQNLERISERPRGRTAAYYLMKNFGLAIVLFMLSQLVSNLIWPLKTNIDVSLGERLLSPAIALWPYAFVIDASAVPPHILYPIFPGQLLITGTVFLPTLVIALLLIVTTLSIRIPQLLKRFLISRDLVLLGVEIQPAAGQRPIVYFRCINATTIALVTGVIAAAIWDWMKTLIFAS
jgi:hypothetical protein